MMLQYLKTAPSLPRGLMSKRTTSFFQTSHGSRTIRRHKHSKVSVQLDYYMSPQFAGIACAMTHQLYSKNGLDLSFLPICPVGLELERVRDHHRGESSSDVTVGSVEQNIFVPTLHAHPDLSVKAIAAMFRRSPLCLASIESSPDDQRENAVVGAHDDTVPLLERILLDSNSSSSTDTNYSSVVSSPRATKITDLLSGKFQAIQAYETTEVPTLERILRSRSDDDHASVVTRPLEGMNGARLGYSQVLFAPERDLAVDDKREILRAFLDATFSGWELAIRDSETAAKSVEEIKALLKLDDEQNDHWDTSFEYAVRNTELCCDYVKETFRGDKYGVIEKERWNDATAWLLGKEDSGNSDVDGKKDFGFDSNIWQPDK